MDKDKIVVTQAVKWVEVETTLRWWGVVAGALAEDFCSGKLEHVPEPEVMTLLGRIGYWQGYFRLDGETAMGERIKIAMPQSLYDAGYADYA